MAQAVSGNGIWILIFLIINRNFRQCIMGSLCYRTDCFYVSIVQFSFLLHSSSFIYDTGTLFLLLVNLG